MFEPREALIISLASLERTIGDLMGVIAVRVQK